MDKDSACFPLIPASTARAARTLYGRGNVYLRLGDRLNDLLSKFDPRILAVRLGVENALLLAVLTVIQYVEELTDEELAASIQQRMDLRYALHLATPCPKLNPQLLCVFRSRLLSDSNERLLFKEIFQSVFPEITTNATKEEPTIEDVLHSICENEVRVSLMEAMLHSVEALSASHFDWLRQIALPHWYQRYNHSMAAANSNYSFGKQELTREDIQGDIQHLLCEIRESNLHDIMEMRETKKLNLIWAQLANPVTTKNCHQCISTIH